MLVTRKRLNKLLQATYVAGVQIGVSLGKSLAQPGGCIVSGYDSKMEQDIDRILKAKEVEL